jgi:hypothetical protein
MPSDGTRMSTPVGVSCRPTDADRRRLRAPHARSACIDMEPTLMSIDELEKKLTGLSGGILNRSKIELLRASIDAIEAALAAGATNRQVLNKLNAAGLELSAQTFATMLRRVRAARRSSTGRAGKQ